MGIDDPGSSLSAIIQIGSVFALLWYFRNDIFKFKIYSSKKFTDYFLYEKLFCSILLSTIPIVLLGGSIIILPNFFDKVLRSNLSIALLSFLMAIFMYLADSSKKVL